MKNYTLTIQSDNPKLRHSVVVSAEEVHGVVSHAYEALFRKALLSLKGEEIEESAVHDDFFSRGYNTAIREMNEKIDEAIKKLEL